MNVKSKHNILFWIVLLLTLIAFLILIFYQNSLRSEIRSLKTQNYFLVRNSQKFNSTIFECHSNISFLTKKINNLKINNSNLEKSYLACSNNLSFIKYVVNNTLEKIDNFQQILNESAEWFWRNSNLSSINNKSAMKTIFDYLDEKCIRFSSGKCTIKTACISLVNSEYEHLNYFNNTNETKTFQSLNDFLNNRGGDCKGYSIFYSAEFNYLINKCKERTNDIFVETFQFSNITNLIHQYFIDFDKDWYYSNADSFEFENYVYPNIICGDIYSNYTSPYGHCIVALTKNEVNPDNFNSELTNSILLEPQSGEFLGLLNNNSSGIYIINNFKNTPLHYIYLVISQRDIIQFVNNSDNLWQSNVYFNNELNNYKIALEQIKNKNLNLVDLTYLDYRRCFNERQELFCPENESCNLTNPNCFIISFFKMTNFLMIFIF